MVRILDFLPPHASTAMSAMDRQNLDIDFGNHFLMTDLPLRYVLQYALNHLRGKSVIANQSPGSVLLLTRSREELQTLMLLEQQRGRAVGATRASCLWRHLFPEDTQQTSTIVGPMDVFEPELWTRIHMRYAPTIDHIQSLFQGLHLEPEDTNGVTSFDAPADITAMTGDNEGRSRTHTRQLPTLVILVGCFSSDHSSPDLNDQNLRLTSESDKAYLENLNTLTSSKAMSAIKDSLDWIANASGQNVDLGIFENTISSNSSWPGSDNTFPIPSPHALWLERTIGFWVETILNVARKRPLSTAIELSSADKEPHDGDGPSCLLDTDSFRLRIKSRESIQELLDAGTSNSVDPGSTLSAMTAIEWGLDPESCTFRSGVSIDQK